MSNVAISVRGRTLSFAAAAGVVALACALLILASRVIQYADTSANGVHVFIEEAPPQHPTRTAPPPPQGGVRIAAPDALPTPTSLPVDVEILARALNCFDRLNRDRREDCPREELEHEYGDTERTRRAYDPSPPRLRLVGAQRAVPPPCQQGFSAVQMDAGGVGTQFCGSWGETPPPPSRSAEQVCVEGGVGPCHPPEFREEDIVRLAHTQ
ncbi:MAG: hypothetical protein R3C27_05940 [Hyphomonadaceae bacterium]